MADDRVLEGIKSRIDIVDLISSHVQLKKSGQNWKGLCPFHSEKTPSFMVSPSKQIFHCFGCGAGGDIFTFTLKYENVTFPEAVKLLAKKAGIAYEPGSGDRKTAKKEETIRGVLSSTTSFYKQMLDRNPLARAYIEKRGISRETADLFSLGYAPQGWNNLLKHLRSKGFSDEIIRESGVAVTGDKRLYDMFRQRIIFPIAGSSGQVIAIGGRAMDDTLPKYLNSPETAVFRKSETLFGLATAKEEIRRENRVIIVEGYIDVIVCYQYGFKNVVAPLGTALTAGHVQKLRKMAERAVIVFDGDQAGRSAARRALPLICQNDYNARVLLLPEGEDPDSYLRKFGSDTFRTLIENARTMIDFFFSTSAGEKARDAREALMLISQVRDALIADEMLIEVADRTRLNETTLREELRKIKTGAQTRQGTSRLSPAPLSNREEHLLLSVIITFPEKTGQVLSRLDLEKIGDPAVASIFRSISSGADVSNIRLLQDSMGDDERRLITRHLVDPGFDLEHVDRIIEDCFRKIERRKFDERLRVAQSSGDLNLINSLLNEKKRFVEGA